MSEFQLLESAAVPPGTAYLVPAGAAFDAPMPPVLLWQRDPWPTSTLPEPAATARLRALDHLAGLLDDWCAELGLDPERAWRGPKIAAAVFVRDAATWRAEERVALSVLNPRAAAFRL